jgi:hypothetical protein
VCALTQVSLGDLGHVGRYAAARHACLCVHSEPGQWQQGTWSGWPKPCQCLSFNITSRKTCIERMRRRVCTGLLHPLQGPGGPCPAVQCVCMEGHSPRLLPLGGPFAWCALHTQNRRLVRRCFLCAEGSLPSPGVSPANWSQGCGSCFLLRALGNSSWLDSYLVPRGHRISEWLSALDLG